MTTHLTKIWWDSNKDKLVEQAIPESEIYKRKWVGLTDEEIRLTDHHRVDGAYDYSFKQGARWAEAKLKENNT